jgi:hypothetical protein
VRVRTSPLAKELKMKIKEKTYLVFIDNSGFDSETECRRMTADEIKKKFNGGELDQVGVAIVEGNLIKGFDSVIDLKRL